MYCKSCDKEIVENITFCPDCGNILEKREVEKVAPKITSTEKQSASKEKEVIYSSSPKRSYDEKPMNNANNTYSSHQNLRQQNIYSQSQTPQQQNTYSQNQAMQRQNLYSQNQTPQQVPINNNQNQGINYNAQNMNVKTPIRYKTSEKAPKSKKKKAIFISSGAGALAIVAVILIFVFTAKTPESLGQSFIDNYLKSSNYQALVDLCYEPAVQRVMSDRGYSENSMDSFIQQGNSNLDMIKQGIFIDEIEANIESIEDADENIYDYIVEMYEEIDATVTEVKDVNIYYKAQSSLMGYTNTTDGVNTIQVVKIDNNWYLHAGDVL